MRFPLTLIAAALLGACASMGANVATPDIPDNAVETVRTEANGDVVSEYRVAGQLRVVRVQPTRGPAYFLMDRNGDGRPDATRSDVSPVYYKLFGW
ncbi:MAG: lipoprotein [Xanthomonadaceae bacterium]|nr:lipoprotein [Xanthomonadaceae bacterium]